MKRYVLLLVAVGLLAAGTAKAQDTSGTVLGEKIAEVKGQVDGLNESFLEVKSVVDALAKIKLSGYIQAQYQVADSDAAPGYAGGNFPAVSHQRFLLRRGRIKFNYDNALTQYVLQIDVTPGGVGIKDAYVSIKEPWLRSVALTAGVFDRPFGFEISYSSSSREAPERSRMYQILFPGERDLGVKIEYLPEKGPLSFLNAKIGLFNGTGPTAQENDNNKDLIGRVGVSLPFVEQNAAVDGGVSFYAGNVRNNSKALWKMNGGKFTVDSSAAHVGEASERTYLGGDFQVYFDMPYLGGASVRGEYITGTQPAEAGSTGFYNPSVVAPLFSRKFAGYYVNYVQNLGDALQFVLKYDSYNPNTDAAKSNIGAAGYNLTAADIDFRTLGVGVVYHYDGNVKFTGYYDIVTNSTISPNAAGSLAIYKNDLKDNVFTLRMQYKF